MIAPDSLRADRADPAVGAAMPALTGKLAHAVRFTQMVSNAGWTLPALSAFLGGTWPLVPAAEGGASLSWLRARQETLPEILSIEGYETAVFWGSTLTSAAPEFSRGFHTVHKEPDADADPAAAPIAWLEDHPPEPFFALIHDVDLQFLRPADGSGDHGGGIEINQHFQSLAATTDRAAARTQTIDAYNHTITRFDAAMGRVLESLAAGGYADHTVVVLVSNHGLDFGEHGGFVHGTTYDSSLRVPLVIADPKGGVGTSDALVQTLDLAPTVLARAGIPNAARFTGTDLGPLVAQPSAPFADRVVYSLNSARLMSARTRTHKLIRVAPGPGAPVRWQGFDLRTDPDERQERGLDAPLQALQAGLGAFAASRLTDKAEGGGESDAALRSALRKQGYWEQVTGPGAAPAKPSPPRDMTPVRP